MKTPSGPITNNASLGIVERFVITRVSKRMLFGGENKEMKFTPAGLRHLKAEVGDTFYMFDGGLVGIAKPDTLLTTAKLNENARFFGGFIDARQRSIKSHYHVRAIYENDQLYWVAAFPYATLSAL